ncbi:Lectin-domain containing receptor kinase A4.3 [Hordeum vulgare]|nr:Lectin-domain containing receptor kinase A4.3 [Hordeum vulgare]
MQQECNKFCVSIESIKARPVSGTGIQDMAFQALEAFRVQHEVNSSNLSHCWRVINEEKFKAQYATIMANGGKKDEEEVVDGEKTRPQGKTNSKKEDKRDTACNAFVATMEGMMTKKDSRKEKRRKDKEDHVNTFMEIQRRRLNMEAEKQAKMFEIEAEKQTRMLDIEAANAKSKAKEVALASMMMGVVIMKVDLNTISRRKRPWFEKMQANMLKFDEHSSMAARAIFLYASKRARMTTGQDGVIELKTFLSTRMCTDR